MRYALSFVGAWLSIIMFLGCSQGQKQGETAPNAGSNLQTGCVRVQLPPKEQPDELLSPPVSMEIASYVISGVRQDGGGFQQTSNGGTTLVSNLSTGNWTITVEAANGSGLVIGNGTGQTTVAAGVTSIMTIDIRPLDGVGNLQVMVTWPDTVASTTVLQALLVPHQGSILPLDIVVGGNAATCTGHNIPTGYCILQLSLLDGTRLVMGAVELVRIVKDQQTEGSCQLNDQDPTLGSVLLNIHLNMADPLTVSMSGQRPILFTNQNMSLSASVAENIGNATYVWYLDGQSIGIGASQTVGNLEPKMHRLDVTAFTTDGRRAGSATTAFSVRRGTLPTPAYAIPCNEGTGATLFETVHNTPLSTTAPSINWCRGPIKGQGDRWYVKSGTNNGSAGVVNGGVISASLSQYTLSFLTRVTEDGGGAWIRFADGLHFRFWGGTWDCSSTNLQANLNNVKRGVWTRITFVQTPTNQLVYVDDVLSAQLVATSAIPSGSVRLGGYEDTSYFYPGEYADVRIYDSALSTGQVGEMCLGDGSNGEFRILGTGADLGGLWRREEHGGQYNSILSAEGTRYRHWFNNDTCWGALSILVPPENPSLWFAADFMYPENLDANHDFGSSVQTIGLYDNYDRSNPMAILYLSHEIIDNGTERSRLRLMRVSYRRSATVSADVELDGREITKGLLHRFEINYAQGTNGLLAFYYDGQEVHRATGNFELPIRQAMYGLNLGIHPQNNGNVVYSDNLYAGVRRLGIP